MPSCTTPPLKATHTGTLRIGGLKLGCHVLSDGTRVFSQAGMLAALGMSLSGGNGAHRISRFVSQDRIMSFSSEGLSARTDSPLRFRPKGGGPEASGYEATLLADIASAVVQAMAHGRLHKQQEHIGQRAAVLLNAFAKLGVIGTVDEATGYQQERAPDALQRKMDAYIADDMGEWGKMFPDELWEQFARLEGFDELPNVRPWRWGKYVMAYVYDAMDKDVGNKLRELNPSPRYRQNHHQWLAEFGKSALTQHLWQLIGVMKTCRSMRGFKNRFAHVFKRAPFQMDWTDDMPGVGAR